MTWTTSTTSTVRDALIEVDKKPTWVRVSAIEAVQPALTNMNRTVIYLAGGGQLSTDTAVQDVLDRMAKAMKP